MVWSTVVNTYIDMSLSSGTTIYEHIYTPRNKKVRVKPVQWVQRSPIPIVHYIVPLWVGRYCGNKFALGGSKK